MQVFAAPSFEELVRVSARIGCLSFGGPAGQIALMHREIVEERGWVSEEQFLQALNFCHFLPGPEAQQLATWIGWKLHGVRGGLAMGLLFVIPGALVILGLSMLYALAADLRWFAALFVGIKATVLAIVVQALLRIAGRALKTPLHKALAAGAFLALAAFALPFPLVVLGAGLIGFAVAATRPDLLGLKNDSTPPPTTPRPWTLTLRAIGIGAVLWAAPMIAVLALLGTDHALWKVGLFFSKLAVVTFGGAYAVLSYMAQQAVDTYGWLRPGEMADGLGLAETTPGPLIMVTQFVGYLAGFRAPEPFSPVVGGLLAAGLTTWVTFVPCFIWIFAFAPWIERLSHAQKLKGGLAAITAAVVGVIANLTLWFAIHVLFRQTSDVAFGPVSLSLPVPQSLDWRVALIATTAAVLIFAMRKGILPVLGICAAAGLVLGWI
ncbi:chromate efflux transporter [Novosphingobium jiangmenense]|uniref:Chromate efflux transporter n=1 Tax=Novosphingobium jiangmenense TaxID=2791981 RepID=A0ABS0HDM7_9SPHN|nr:chromate efflux transporter [Novosphingobium jiangmenense]MBF9150379.1 chromate efflux transporter [Novosphingobium jiangmenense]